MSDLVPQIEYAAVCETCGRVIATLKGTRIGWLHFTTHDGHVANPRGERHRDA